MELEFKDEFINECQIIQIGNTEIRLPSCMIMLSGDEFNNVLNEPDAKNLVVACGYDREVNGIKFITGNWMYGEFIIATNLKVIPDYKGKYFMFINENDEVIEKFSVKSAIECSKMVSIFSNSKQNP